MSADEGKKDKGSTTVETGKATKIDINVDSEQMKRLLKDLETKDKEAKELQEKLEKAVKDKETAETTLEEKTTEADDFKAKLALIAEQKLNAKRKIILDKAKEVIKDEDRLKKISEGMKSPEDVQATEFMIDTLAQTLEEGKKQHEEMLAKEKLDETRKALLEKFPDAKEKIEGAENIEGLEALRKELTPKTDEGAGTGDEKPPEKATGVTKLGPAQTGAKGEGYDSHQAMVRDLRKMEHSDNPEEAAYAKTVLDELFRKWSVAVKKRYEGKSRGFDISPESTEGIEQPPIKEITKRGGEAN